MNELNIHQNIKNKLKYFVENQKVPNIIFNGPNGSGKSTLLKELINMIYNKNEDDINNFVMYVNCAHGKGIKFIREELKLFAKTNIISTNNEKFKVIVLFNGDKLTIDAQSALRRCIELFSHNTRFFILVEDKYKLLKPILSRFCEIYIPEPLINNDTINLYKYNVNKILNLNEYNNKRKIWLINELENNKKKEDFNLKYLLDFIDKIYQKGYCALDILNLLEENIIKLKDNKQFEYLVSFNKVKKEIKNEKLLLLFILNFVLLNNNENLENIIFF